MGLKKCVTIPLLLYKLGLLRVPVGVVGASASHYSRRSIDHKQTKKKKKKKKKKRDESHKQRKPREKKTQLFEGSQTNPTETASGRPPFRTVLLQPGEFVPLEKGAGGSGRESAGGSGRARPVRRASHRSYRDARRRIGRHPQDAVHSSRPVLTMLVLITSRVQGKLRSEVQGARLAIGQ